MKSKTSSPLPSIEKGQLWKTEEGNVEIMEVGRLLTNYRLLRGEKRPTTQMGRVQMVREFLRDKGGKLIKNRRLVKTGG
jgi:hypothetical protein